MEETDKKNKNQVFHLPLFSCCPIFRLSFDTGAVAAPNIDPYHDQKVQTAYGLQLHINEFVTESQCN